MFYGLIFTILFVYYNVLGMIFLKTDQMLNQVMWVDNYSESNKIIMKNQEFNRKRLILPNILIIYSY